MEAIQLAANRRFARSIREAIRGRSMRPFIAMTDASLEDEITRLIGRAQGYGLSADHDLMAFVALALNVAPDFDRHPPFHRVLTDPSIPGRQKMRALFQEATGQDWERAASMGDGDELHHA